MPHNLAKPIATAAARAGLAHKLLKLAYKLALALDSVELVFDLLVVELEVE